MNGVARKNKPMRGFIGVLGCILLTGGFTVFASSCVGTETEPIGAAKAMSEYYISPDGNDLAEGTKEKPLRSLRGAFKAIKANKEDFTTDIKIYLADGNYFMGDADVVDIDGSYLPDDVEIMVLPEPNATPVLNGGKTVTEWQETQLNGQTVFSAQLEKGLDGIYSLMVNGKAADIAKSIDEEFDGRNLSFQNSHGAPFAEGSFSWNYYNVKDKSQGIEVKNNLSLLSKIVSPSQTQAVWLIEWKEFLINVEEIAESRITSSYWDIIAKEIDVSSGAEFFWPAPKHRFYLQNDISFVTEPGEFCYDKSSGILYYYPREGEKMTDLVAEIPLTSKLIDMTSTIDKGLIKNITFRGITFVNTCVDYIDRYGGFAINQGQQFEIAAPTGTVSTPIYHRGMMGATVSLEYCKNVNFVDCTFKNLGLTAISFGEGTKNCKIEGCIFTDLGNCAVMVSDPTNYSVGGSAQICDNRIENNVIRRIGRINRSSPAILVHYANGTVVSHNDIYDCPYTAVSVGWGWAKVSNSYAGNNTVSYNRIGNYLTVLKDGGGVYTLGNQPNSLIERNYFYSQRNNIAGVYLDEGTSGYTVRHNALYLNDLTDEYGNLIEADYCKKIPSMYWLNLNDASGKAGTAESVMSDIKVISNFYFMSNGYGKTDAHTGNVIPPILNDDENEPVLRNVSYATREEFLSSNSVMEIMEQAGLTSEYQTLLSKV